MKKTSIDPQMYVFMSSFLLPDGMLDFFDVVRIDEEPLPQEKVYRGGILHIYLDEQDNRTKAQSSLSANGLLFFMSVVVAGWTPKGTMSF